MQTSTMRCVKSSAAFLAPMNSLLRAARASLPTALVAGGPALYSTHPTSDYTLTQSRLAELDFNAQTSARVRKAASFTPLTYANSNHRIRPQASDSCFTCVRPASKRS